MLACMKKNYTNESINKTKKFTLSVLPADTDPFVIGNFGFQSSRDVDKWSNVPHTIKDGLPLLNDAVACLRLLVTDSKDFPTHTMFLCEVIDGELGASTAKPLIYGDYQAMMKSAASEAFTKFKENGKPPEFRKTESSPTPAAQSGTKWVCSVCGYIYEDSLPFEELRNDWVCPVCGVGKDKFEKTE
jgi:rubredoxin/flavin reductase (DIM6/NTAB) family NADH-FMN oxidoreductase RutF